VLNLRVVFRVRHKGCSYLSVNPNDDPLTFGSEEWIGLKVAVVVDIHLDNLLTENTPTPAKVGDVIVGGELRHRLPVLTRKNLTFWDW
jgi:hypothetical protein